MSIPFQGSEYKDFEPYMNKDNDEFVHPLEQGPGPQEYSMKTVKRPKPGVFCSHCGLEITHGIKGNEYCSKACFYEAMSQRRAEQSNPYNTAREMHNKEQTVAAIRHTWR